MTIGLVIPEKSDWGDRFMNILKTNFEILDQHPQGDVLSAGKSGGQTIYGGTGASENLVLKSTSHATKGKIQIGSLSAYDEANARLGIGTVTPAIKLSVSVDGSTPSSSLYSTADNILLTNNEGNGIIRIVAASVSGGNYGAVNLVHARGSLVTPLSSVAEDILGSLNFQGFAGSRNTAIQVMGQADSAVSTGILPARLLIKIENTSGSLNEIVRITATKFTINGGLNVGDTTDPGDNNLYVVGNCSALSFTDRTPAYDGDALAEIKLISHTSKHEIDHNTLPEFARSKYRGAADGKERTGRDLGAMISILVKAVQQLTTRIEALEAS